MTDLATPLRSPERMTHLAQLEARRRQARVVEAAARGRRDVRSAPRDMRVDESAHDAQQRPSQKRQHGLPWSPQAPPLMPDGLD